MASNTDESPFHAFETDVNAEQLKTWKEMNKKVRGLVQMSDEEEEDEELVIIDDSLLVTETPTESCEDQSRSDPSRTSPQESTKNKLDFTSMLTPANMDLTLQYLAGKITFLEFSDIMEKNSAEEENEVDQNKETGDVPDAESGLGSSVAAVDDNMDTSQTKGKEPVKTKKIPKKKRRRCDLPKNLEQDMGEVNIKFAQGQHEEAIQMCMEIIRMAPEAYKPFQTLGMIYDDMGDMKKSLQYFLIAAYLNPSDEDEWVRLAEICLELNEINQAIKCYSQAINLRGKNRVECLWERSSLYEQLKDHKKALEGFQAAQPLLDEQDSEKQYKLAWAITRNYHELGEKNEAIDTMLKAFKKYSDNITSEDVNLLLELLIGEKMFAESVDIFVQYCGVEFILAENKKEKGMVLYEDFNNIEPVQCQVPEILAIDLRVKLCICLIHLRFAKLTKSIMHPLFDEDIEENGDLYLDVAEAYMDNSYYKQAQPVIKKLVSSQNYNLAAVWLRYGECLKCLGDIAGAVKAYSVVVELAPSHLGARMSLSALQQQLGKHDEALEALTNDFEDRKPNTEEQKMLLQKCHLLKARGKIEECLRNAKQLLFHEWRDVEAENMSHLDAIRTYKHRKESLLFYFESKGKDVLKLGSNLKLDARTKSLGLDFEDLWDLFKTLSVLLINEGRVTAFDDFSLLGMMCPLFGQEEKKQEFEFFILIASIVLKNPRRAYTFGRHLVLEEISGNHGWNLFMQVIMMCNDTRHNRFCLRRMLHEPNNIQLGIMNGHNSMGSGSYKHSLGEYANVFRRQPMDPMISLCIGLDFIHCASQRFAAKRHYLVTQGLAFLNNYTALRGECQETYYNLGRALHQINILYAAVHYYKKVLSLEPCLGEKGGSFDLTKEAAYNLALIYINSGSADYGKYLLYKYCVI